MICKGYLDKLFCIFTQKNIWAIIVHLIEHNDFLFVVLDNDAMIYLDFDLTPFS